MKQAELLSRESISHLEIDRMQFSPNRRKPFEIVLSASAMHGLLPLLAACLASLANPLYGQNLTPLEQEAIRAAVQEADASVVRLEPVGITTAREGVGLSLAPSTALVVSAEGHLISTTFGIPEDAGQVVAIFADGTRTIAAEVARDHSRRLVLWKTESESPLPVLPVANPSEVHVGEWAIAVGRTYSASHPSISVGIVSALNRVWGMALQTDAKVSPVNYGGPLLDIEGRVLGILAPLMPEGTDDLDAVRRYDAGVGFAVPMWQVRELLSRLQKGEDLHAGVLGIALVGRNPFGPVVIGACQAGSPAALAGLRQGDRIVAAEGQPIRFRSDFLYQLRPKYAGEELRLTVEREGEQIEIVATLVEELPPYERPYLGILPDLAANVESGVPVRYVFPGSPAQAAGIEPGSVILQADGQDITSVESLLAYVRSQWVGAKVTFRVERSDAESMEVEITLQGLPQELSLQPPPLLPEPVEGEAAEVATGRINPSLPEHPQTCLGYVPEAYDPRLPLGVMLWLAEGTSEQEREALLAAWQPVCDEFQTMLLVPSPEDGQDWSLEDAEYLQKLIEQTTQRYEIDSRRVVAVGSRKTAALAFRWAAASGGAVGGVVLLEAPLPATLVIPPASPESDLSLLLVASPASNTARPLIQTKQRLREKKHPVAVLTTRGTPLDPEEADREAVLRWIDALSRI